MQINLIFSIYKLQNDEFCDKFYFKMIVYTK